MSEKTDCTNTVDDCLKIFKRFKSKLNTEIGLQYMAVNCTY